MSIRYRLYKQKVSLLAMLRLFGRRFRRAFMDTGLTRERSFSVPIVLNNRNRVSYLRDLVDWLSTAGYTNIHILDNASTFPPVNDYYRETKAKVWFLGRNAGYKALWETELFHEIKSGYYVYSDADLIPGDTCPADLVFRLYEILKRYPVEKCGPALRISDLPDHYQHKQKVLDNERPFWLIEKEPNVYLAPVDTTFALYKPLAWGNAEECRALRAGGDLEFIHRPWYEDSSQPDAETRFYIEHASQSSVWYKQMNDQER